MRNSGINWTRSRQKSFSFEKLERKTNNTLFVLLVFFFLKFPKNLIFRFVPYSFISSYFSELNTSVPASTISKNRRYPSVKRAIENV